LTETQHLNQKILLNVRFHTNESDILYSAEKGHQMMPFLLLVRQILFQDFPKTLANS